jgi:hypothetical protein
MLSSGLSGNNMVLDMPSLFQLFPESGATGEGLGSDLLQQFINQADADGSLSGKGTTDLSKTPNAAWQDWQTVTVLEPGKYLVIFTTSWSSVRTNSATTQFYFNLRVGATDYGGVTCHRVGSAANQIWANCTAICAVIDLSAGDVVQAQLYNNQATQTITNLAGSVPNTHHRQIAMIKLVGVGN